MLGRAASSAAASSSSRIVGNRVIEAIGSRMLRCHGQAIDRDRAKKLYINFVDKHGKKKTVEAYEGMTVLSAAHENDVEVEGACEGSLACSTCHVIIENESDFDKFPAASDREEDLLDLAPGLTETSRLCCQLKLKPELHDGVTFRLPSSTRNFYVDGFVPKPH